MVKKKNKFVVMIFIVLAIVFLISNSGLLPQSIVSVSNINFAENENVWVANAVINQSNEVISFNQNYTSNPMSTTLNNGGELTARSRIDVAFTQGQPTCKYDIFAIQKPINVSIFPIQNFTYYQLGQFERDYPFSIDIYKYPALDLGGGRNLLESKTISFSDGTTVPLLNGDIKLNNLGALQGVTDCPSSAGTFLVPRVDSSGSVIGYVFATEASTSIYISNLNNAIAEASNPFTAVTGVTKLFNLLSNPQILTASQFIGFSDYEVESSQVVLNMPYTSGFADITLEASNNLFDSVTYYPPNPIPEITNLVLKSGNIDQTQQTELWVTVKNVGTEGSIDLIAYNTEGLTTFTPSSDKISLKTNESITYTFKVYGAKDGGDTVCVRAIGNQSGASDDECVGLIISDVSGVVDPVDGVITPPNPNVITCGNGVCDVSENSLTCLRDCPIVPPSGGIGSVLTPEERCDLIASDGFVVIDYNPSFNLLGGFVGCNPVYNFGGILLIIGIVVALGFILVVFVSMPKRGRSRR